ncbi:hypothetical protein OFB79_26580, partial [Escherichia coli]|nr:hypothetical protein [Escherichia coli]
RSIVVVVGTQARWLRGVGSSRGEVGVVDGVLWECGGSERRVSWRGKKKDMERKGHEMEEETWRKKTGKKKCLE